MPVVFIVIKKTLDKLWERLLFLLKRVKMLHICKDQGEAREDKADTFIFSRAEVNRERARN